MSKPITLSLLKRLGACEDQVDKFAEEYGEAKPPMTVDEAVRVAHMFDFGWLANKLLKGEALKAYDKAIDLHRKAYYEATASHREAYWKALLGHLQSFI